MNGTSRGHELGPSIVAFSAAPQGKPLVRFEQLITMGLCVRWASGFSDALFAITL